MRAECLGCRAEGCGQACERANRSQAKRERPAVAPASPPPFSVPPEEEGAVEPVSQGAQPAGGALSQGAGGGEPALGENRKRNANENCVQPRL